MGIEDTLVQEIIRRVRTASNATRIILFGSAAADRMTRDSDIDLLVIEPEPGDIRRESPESETPCAVSAIRLMSSDVIVMSAERFEEIKEIIGGIAYPANKYGEVIYEGA